jgi:hypothetical protein
MNFLILTFVFCLVDLALAHNKSRLGVAETTRPANFHSAGTSSSSVESLATIQIQIGDLSGSGVIPLSNVITAPESSRTIRPNQTSIVTESMFTSCITSFSPETTAILSYLAPSTLSLNETARTSGIQSPATLPYVAPSTLNFNATTGTSSIRRSLTPTAAPTDSSLFADSGAQANPRVPEMSALLLAVVGLTSLL